MQCRSLWDTLPAEIIQYIYDIRRKDFLRERVGPLDEALAFVGRMKNMFVNTYVCEGWFANSRAEIQFDLYYTQIEQIKRMKIPCNNLYWVDWDYSGSSSSAEHSSE